MMGLRVVGNPAATVIISSPGLAARLPNTLSVQVVTASRLALLPLLVRVTPRTVSLKNRRMSFSNWLVMRPSVKSISSTASIREATSSPSSTLPDTLCEMAYASRNMNTTREYATLVMWNWLMIVGASTDSVIRSM